MSATYHDTCPDFSPAGRDGKRLPGDATLRPLWSPLGGFDAPPPVGARVYARINQFGPARVVGYFTEYGYLGVRLQPDVRPEWHLLQQPGREVIMLFGAEIRPIMEADERERPEVSPAAVACPTCGVEVGERCALARDKWHAKRRADAKLLGGRVLAQRTTSKEVRS